jgi:hypothetical protein
MHATLRQLRMLSLEVIVCRGLLRYGRRTDT